MLQFMALGTTEIVLIVLAVVLLFGGKKIPELMKGVGQGVRSFKDGMKDVEKEINATDDKKSDENK
ncbi:MAG: twin-arginine translocase TatA/TatE family subunit [Rikenellaceae bacterium]|nr:twin-arginine translocase TatA/TatE family subunit [Rikenellaceae bacterium]